MFFAGIEARGWTSVRKVKDGPTTDDLFAFLTCPPNAEVGAIHPKAMPVIQAVYNSACNSLKLLGCPSVSLPRKPLIFL